MDTLDAIIIPDTHGHLQQAEQLVDKMRKRGFLDGRKLVFLGDYFDRGPDVRGLVDFCIGLQEEGHVMLAGNHEYTLAQALFAEGENREAWAERWGKKYEWDTLISYDVPDIWEEDIVDWVEKADELKEVMPKDHQEFLKSLPWFYETPTLVAVHAGVEPRQTWKSQKKLLARRDMSSVRGPSQLFSHELAVTVTHNIGKLVVSGHATFYKPYISSTRAFLDCGVDSDGPLVGWVRDIDKIVTVGKKRRQRSRNTPLRVVKPGLYAVASYDTTPTKAS